MTSEINLPGLVISDKTARAETPGSVFESRFVSPGAIEQAASTLPSLPSRAKNDNRTRYAVELSPGSVRVTRSAPAGTTGKPPGYRTKAEIVRWSAKSRANMSARLCSLDYQPLLAHENPPALITLTYPKEWQVVVPTGSAVKKHLKAFRQRYERKYGQKLIGLWKLEFMRRYRNPHIHIFCAPPNDIAFRSWLSATWADIVAHPDPAVRAKHERAGTGIDYEKGLRSYHAKRVATYFSKHGSPNTGAKEYQNQPPREWVDARDVGRFWGYWGLQPFIVRVEVEDGAALYLTRILRRWSHANSQPTRRRVKRVDTRSGVVRERWLRRRGSKRRMSGRLGFLSVDDGAAIGVVLAKALQARDVWDRYDGEL
jgi:hypothetical protein